ncbi:MAG: lactate dehydrogenase, partial [Coriobacteriia bacterium]|nr:lactate dehydrogenase [Coriobacteriia bacterium]
MSVASASAAPEARVRLFAYAMRTFDELGFFEEVCRERNVELGWTSDYPSLDNAALATGYDVVCVMPSTIDRPLIQAWLDLGIHAIATRNIGVDHIDLDSCRDLGVRVSHATYTPESVADYAIMLAMMCLRRMPQITDRARVQDYTLRGKMGRALCDCTVGIVGTGRIGSTVVSHLKGFGCKMLAYDVRVNESVAADATYVSLDELLAQSDVVTLHAPLTADNHHMIDERALGLMKPDAVLVNTARGGLIDTEALISALEA